MLLNSKRHIDRHGAEVNMIKFTVQHVQYHYITTIKTIDVMDGSCEIT